MRLPPTLPFSSLLIGKFSGSQNQKSRCGSVDCFQFPPHREVLWQKTELVSTNDVPNAFSSLLIGKFSGSRIGAERLPGVGLLLSVPSSSGSSLAGMMPDAGTITGSTFQFPPHREVLWQATARATAREAAAFQFPPHREVLWQPLFSSYSRVSFLPFSSLLIGKFSGSARHGTTSNVTVSFQFPPHREVLWQNDSDYQRRADISAFSSLLIGKFSGRSGIALTTLMYATAFQFPPHREVLWQSLSS